MRIAILVLTAAAGLCAQSFEVTSVKVNKSSDGSASIPHMTKGRMETTNATMRWILQAAWGFNSLQINGPGWIDSDRFDLAGTAPEGVPDTEMKPMLQALLKERFHLAAHVEKKEMPVYNLIVFKDGPKMSLIGPDFVYPPAPPRMPGAQGMLIGPKTMPELASVLTGVAGRPVVDKTGMEGRYFSAVQYSQLGATSDPDQAPDIFGAVQQQLGLKLEPARAELDALVVEHLERTPTEN